LVYDDANYVSSSSTDAPDILVITFVNRKLFFDEGGEYLITEELMKAIKRQLPKNRETEVFLTFVNVVEASSKTGTLGVIAINFVV